MDKGVLLAGEPLGLFTGMDFGKLEETSLFTCGVAGAEFNVAVGLSRLGHRAGYFTKLGDDPFGRRILRVLRENGIGTETAITSADRSTGFMLKNKVAAGDPEIFYFRRNSAASTITREEVETIDLSRYGCLHMTGIFPALSPSTREAAFALAEGARKKGLSVSFDPNLRPQLWGSQDEMRDVIQRLAAFSDIVLPGIGEARILTGCGTPEQAAAAYRELDIRTVVIKLGAQGAFVSDEREGEFCVEPFPLPQERIVDTVGAGDGFAAGLLSALLEGKSLREAVVRANAVGAIQLCFAGDNEGLPTWEELEHFMRTGDIRGEKDE